MSSAVLAVTGGIVGQMVFTMWHDRHTRYKMRVVLYLDLERMFTIVDVVMGVSGKALGPLWQEDQIRRGLTFHAEAHLRGNPETYYQLRERSEADMLYLDFHRIADDMNSLPVNSSLALRMFANMVHAGKLDRGCFMRFLGRKRAMWLLERIDAHQREDEELRRQLEAARRAEAEPGENSKADAKPD
jgi:hypothetical protein